MSSGNQSESNARGGAEGGNQSRRRTHSQSESSGERTQAGELDTNQSRRESSDGQNRENASSNQSSGRILRSARTRHAGNNDRNSADSASRDTDQGGSNNRNSTDSGSTRTYRLFSDSNSEVVDRSNQDGAIDNDVRPNRNIPDLPSMYGPTHNSLIQIRRGARQEDGSFSFSISVHTSSGRTILFDQHDLESDDEDSDIRIERIIPNMAAVRSMNTADNSREERNENLESNREPSNNSTENAGRVRHAGRYDDVNDIWDNSDVEQESEHDLMEEDEFDFGASDDEIINSGDNLIDDNRFDINLPSFPANDNDDVASAEANDMEEIDGEPLFRNTGPSRIRRVQRRNNNQTTRNEDNHEENNTSGNSDQSASGSAVDRSVRTMADSENSRPSDAVDSRPTNNSFMFVLESNTGTRRRRVLNLSYLDTYTEPESKLLQKNIHSNKNRLLNYIEECNVGKGFIKEVTFSSDGRFISSPYGFGIRLFAFDKMCNELCDCVPSSPVKLYQAACSLAHDNYVVATQFSPVHNLVVSGCLDGKIAFHQPVF